MKAITVKVLMVVILLCVAATSVAATHNHQMKKDQNEKCQVAAVECSKTVTSAFAPNGDLWRVWVVNQGLYYQISKDQGGTFAKAVKVSAIKEKISARNENRPKIGFDKYQGVYLAWAMPREKKYTADVRFSYSPDYGKTFSTPVTVNNDNLLTGHSFNEMLVTPEGDIHMVWLDGRHSYQLRKQGKATNGSALYFGQANYRQGKTRFTNQQLANNTCVCCRIAMDFNQQGDLAILWRHIYGDNIREFALTTFKQGRKNEVIQVSNDHWKINGCPHQGGAISIDTDDRYHMAWFNLGSKGKGIFYASSDNQGKTHTPAIAVGDINSQAAHPHMLQSDEVVDIVWTQFNGIEHQLWHQQSRDNGITFSLPKQLAQARNGSDRPFIIKQNNRHYVSWQRPKQGHWVQAL